MTAKRLAGICMVNEVALIGPDAFNERAFQQVVFDIVGKFEAVSFQYLLDDDRTPFDLNDITSQQRTTDARRGYPTIDHAISATMIDGKWPHRRCAEFRPRPAQFATKWA
jgi:hypothetical protein